LALFNAIFPGVGDAEGKAQASFPRNHQSVLPARASLASLGLAPARRQAPEIVERSKFGQTRPPVENARDNQFVKG
jgi:hypothetical protein